MALFSRKRQEPATIDLRDTPPPARFEFGQPTLCPACASPGYLDSIDIKGRVMYQHCPACMAKWETTEAELESTRA
jgi:formate dehydrogenase maturation protein FdhE